MNSYEKIDANIIDSVYGGFSEMKSEIVLNIQVKSIVKHHEGDNLDAIVDVMFDEIQAASSVPAENWSILDYKITQLGDE